MEGLLSMGPRLSSFNAEGMYSCMIGSKLTAVLPDQAVLEKHKFLFWQTCLLNVYSGGVGRARVCNQQGYPV